MSRSLTDSPLPSIDGWQVEHPEGDGDIAPFEVLGEARWQGVELLFCREDIRRPTHWSIGQSRHTVIVHLGGTMHSLATEIEGAGACHVSPSPGDIWLIPAEHRYSSLARGRLITYAELRIQPDALVELPDDACGRLDALPARMAHRDEFLYYAVARLARLATAADDLAVMMAERLQHLLRQHLHREYRPQGPCISPPMPREGLGPASARRVTEYIEEHLADRIRLDDLAALCGMTVHRLLVAFRRTFGTTPAQFVLDRRLVRARWLLLNTSEDISGIALSTGFASHSHFSAAFKRRMGTSPRTFREAHRTLRLDFASKPAAGKDDELTEA